MKRISNSGVNIHLKRQLLGLIFFAYGMLNYNPQLLFKSNYQHWGWNFALLASVLIITLMKLRNPLDWKKQLGINFNKRDIYNFIGIVTLLLVLAYFLVVYSVSLNNYSFKPMLLYYKQYYSLDCPFPPILGHYFYYIPETFNEEMIIGAFLLFAVEKRFVRLNKTLIAVSVALLFSLMHEALYAWSPVQPGILLTVNTLATLFFVGVIRNVLILKTRKIAYSWALHLSFNLVFFSGFFINNSSNKMPTEPETFNIVFGNWLMLTITGSAAIALILWMNKENLSFETSK